MAARRRLPPEQKMTPLGVNFPAEQRAQLELLARHEDRPIGWLVRIAVFQYLQARQEDIAKYTAMDAAKTGDPA